MTESGSTDYDEFNIPNRSATMGKLIPGSVHFAENAVVNLVVVVNHPARCMLQVKL